MFLQLAMQKRINGVGRYLATMSRCIRSRVISCNCLFRKYNFHLVEYYERIKGIHFICFYFRKTFFIGSYWLALIILLSLQMKYFCTKDYSGKLTHWSLLQFWKVEDNYMNWVESKVVPIQFCSVKLNCWLSLRMEQVPIYKGNILPTR